MTNQMKAVMFEKVGGPEVLITKSIPIPRPTHGQVLIRVRACALNRLDYYLRIEEDPEMPMPHILGSDISGEITECGPGVRGWEIDAPVVVSPAIFEPDGTKCKIIGYQTQGGYAEYCVVPADNLLTKPNSLSYEEASTIPLVYMTAHHQMFARGKLCEGETVLILGANSGIGTAAVQLGHSIGAKVIAVARGRENLQKAKTLGADFVYDMSDSQWAKQVGAEIGESTIDLVVDHLGGPVVDLVVPLMAQYGRIVSIGSTLGDSVTIRLSDLYRKQLSILGSYMGDKEELSQVMDLFSRGKLLPVVSKTFPLEKAKEAHEFMERGGFFGKIVLTVS